MLDCEWMDDLLSISGIWWQNCSVHQTTPKHQVNLYLETDVRQEAVRETHRHENVRATHLKPNRRETEMFNSCHSWTIFFANAHSSRGESQLYNLKTMKQSSQGQSKEEVRQRDVGQEPTEMQLIGCWTESIWIQEFRLTMKPRTNLQTYEPHEITHAMNGITFSICWTSWTPFLSLKSKAERTECFVERNARIIFKRKFTKGEDQIYEFGDGKIKIYFMGAAQYVEFFLFARHEWLRKPGECWGWTRQCSHAHLEANVEHESIPNRTLSRVEIGTDWRRKYLGTGTKEREFTLDMHLKTGAECRHIQLGKRIWCRDEPDASLLVKCTKDQVFFSIVQRLVLENSEEILNVSLTAVIHHGQRQRYLIHRWSSGQEQTSMYNQTRSYVWEK